jgi:hypothetical protein
LNAKKASFIIECIKQYLASEELHRICRRSNKFFTRSRLLPFATLTTFIINIVRKSLQVEINSFFNLIKLPSVTKQAFSQARKKLSAHVFVLLNEKLITEFYSDNEIKTYKGFRILAVDGSTLQLPDTEELAEKYGRHINKNATIPLAKTSVLFDVLNQITIHAILRPFRTAEKDMAMEHIQELAKFDHLNKDKFIDLLMFDRGYPSAFLIFFLLHHNKQFLMRSHSAFIHEVKEAINSGLRDTIVAIPAFREGRSMPSDFKKYLPHIKSNDIVQVRVLVFDLPNGNQEILITSLLDQKTFSSEDIFMLYGKRWDIEEEYKLYKHITEIENFSGESALAIEQDFHATVLTCNMTSLLMQEAQDEIDEKHADGDRKYAYKINRCVAIGTMKNEVVEMLLGNHNLEAYCSKLKDQMKKSLVPIRPGRSYQRPKRVERKWPSIRKSPL